MGVEGILGLERRGNASSAYLRAGAAMFAAVDRVNEALFDRFVSELELDFDYRGAEGIGWAQSLRSYELDQFRAGGREDLAVKDEGEIALLNTYLPPAADASAIEAAVDAAIAETGAASVKDMGKVMKATLEKLSGVTADGRMVSETVKRKLTGAAGG